MRCHEVRNRTSEYIDRWLGEVERREFEAHVAGCATCRARLEETRGVASGLRTLVRPAPPPDLRDSTLVALDRACEPALTIVTHRHTRLARPFARDLFAVARRLFSDYEFKLIAYSLGLVISFGLFGGVLASMRPMLSIAEFDSPMRSIWIMPTESQALGYRTMPVAYSLPRVSEKGRLPEYFAAAGLPGAEELVVIAEITPDGRGSIVEVLSGPEDQVAVGGLAHVISHPRSFVPAYAASGRPVASRVVLFVERVDVLG